MYKVQVGRHTFQDGLNQWEAQVLARDLRKQVKNVKVTRG